MGGGDMNEQMERLAGPPDDRTAVGSIEISFAMPVYVTSQQEMRLHDLVRDIVYSPCNQPVDGVHWPSSNGCKPIWSKQDAKFLGKEAAHDAPESGEPAFIDSIHFIETSARAFLSPEEKASTLRDRARKQADCPIEFATRPDEMDEAADVAEVPKWALAYIRELDEEVRERRQAMLDPHADSVRLNALAAMVRDFRMMPGTDLVLMWDHADGYWFSKAERGRPGLAIEFDGDHRDIRGAIDGALLRHGKR